VRGLALAAARRIAEVAHDDPNFAGIDRDRIADGLAAPLLEHLELPKTAQHVAAFPHELHSWPLRHGPPGLRPLPLVAADEQRAHDCDRDECQDDSEKHNPVQGLPPSCKLVQAQANQEGAVGQEGTGDWD